jgi:glycosyltransferase involved in cell wall biosynthesis
MAGPSTINRERITTVESREMIHPPISDTEVDRPLRIALVHSSDQGGGAEASTLSLHRTLRQLGHSSFLFVGAKYTDDPHVIEIKRHRCLPGVLRTVQWLERRNGWQYLYQPWFRRLDRLFPQEMDVIHFHSLWGGQHGYADLAGLPRLTRRYPALMTLRDQWMLTGHCACPTLNCERWQRGCGQCPDLSIAPAIPHDGTAFNWRRKHAAIQRSDLRIITVSNWLGDVAGLSPIFSGKEIHTVYNGVDDTVFQPQSKEQARREFGLPEDAVIVMLAGQSVEGTSQDGTGATEYALNALAGSQRTIFLLAVGHSAEKVLSRWGQAGRAMPFQSDPAQLAKLYAAADIVLVASLWETFGRVPAEAQMCGIPVASFATGGIPEVVEDHVTGLLVPRQHTVALAHAVQTLIDHPSLRRQMGDAATPRARRLFSNRTIAENYVRHYREVMAVRRPVAGAT